MKSHRTKKSRPSCSKKSRANKIVPVRAPLPATRPAAHAARSIEKSVAPANQIPQPPFASLDFPGRETLNPREVARRIGCSVDHIYDLILEGQLRAIDI